MIYLKETKIIQDVKTLKPEDYELLRTSINACPYDIYRRCKAIIERLYEPDKIRRKIRTGTETHGFITMEELGGDPDNLNIDGQNIDEHSQSTAVIDALFYCVFPEIRQYYSNLQLIVDLIHDFEEGRSGDFADVGGYSAEECASKREREYAYIEWYVSVFDKETADEILRIFRDFQDEKGPTRVADKLDWIVYTFLQAKYGNPGSFDYKMQMWEATGLARYKITDQDHYAMETTGSKRPFDAMVLHFITHSENIYRKDIFIAFLACLYLELDGELPAWFGDDVAFPDYG